MKLKTKKTIAIMMLFFVYIISHTFLIWQFDQTIGARLVWGSPWCNEDAYDMWLIGAVLFGRRYISMIDIYNSWIILIYFFVPVLPLTMVLGLIAWKGKRESREEELLEELIELIESKEQNNQKQQEEKT